MLFLLAAVSIPRNQITNTPRPAVGSWGTNAVLSAASWFCTFPLLVPAAQTSVLADRRAGFFNVSDTYFASSRAPLGSANTTELVDIAQGMTQEPMMYIQACALLMLGLVVVLELTTNTKEVQYFSKHANQSGEVSVSKC